MFMKASHRLLGRELQYGLAKPLFIIIAVLVAARRRAVRGSRHTWPIHLCVPESDLVVVFTGDITDAKFAQPQLLIRDYIIPAVSTATP